MTIARITTKFVLYLYYLLKYRHERLAFHLANNNIHPRKCVAVKRQGKELYFAQTGARLPLHLIGKYFRRSMHYIIEIFGAVRVDELTDHGDKICLSSAGIVFDISTESGAGNFYEIVCRNMYGYVTAKKDLVVLDIGMNAGLASLYFARMENVARVYAFEPFPSTVKTATGNFSLNPSLNRKITVNGYGISDHSGRVEVPLFEDASMEASTNKEFIEAHQFHDLKEGKKTEIELRDIAEVLREITAQESLPADRPLVLKIDCEGEEYNILRKIEEAGLFGYISAFLIEWHHKGPDPLVAALKRNGFNIFLSPISTVDGTLIKEAGMIYAFA